MTPPDDAERWRELQRIVDGALDLPPTERQAHLTRSCGTDEDLHERAAQYLIVCERAARGEGILAAPASAFAGPMLASLAAQNASSRGSSRTALGAALQAALAGRYVIERELGRGGMATVYLARDLRHDRAVAVKVLEGSIAPAAAQRFQHEIAIAARLTHPHVLGLHDSGDADGLLYYVMPYVDGETLRARLTREGALPIGDATRLVRELADALAFAHRHGVMHRDLKPENVLLSEGHAVVADFGIAKALAATLEGGAPRAGLTSTGVSIGTPAYMAPEQAVGDAATDHRADLYALGVIAYEMIAGVHPFGARAPQALVAAHLTETPTPLGERRAALPPALTGLVMRLLAKDPAARPQKADEILRALDDSASHDGTPRAPMKRRGALVAAAVAIAIVAAAGVGYATWLGASRANAGMRGTGLPAATTRPSVAVLPFQNTSGAPADEHFSDGLTDELIGALGKVADLKVAGRTSAFALKGTRLSMRAIAETLGVNSVLEGSVRRAGSRFRVGAQLVSAADGSVLWTETYDRELSDVFAVQEEIARAIVGALRVRLGASDGPRVRRATSDSIAYQLYLKGRFVFATGRGMDQAIGYFQQAVARDPSYAAAYSGLSDAYTRQAVFGLAPAREALTKATKAAERALALDSTLAEAHVSLGHARMQADFAWDYAESRFQNAIKLDPSYAFARAPYAIGAASRGRYAEAIAILDTARGIDPLSLPLMNLLGRIYVGARRPDEAIAILQQSIELDPQGSLAYEQLGHAYLLKSMPGEAISALRSAAALSGSRDSAQLAYAYAVTGNRPEAERILRDLLDPKHRGPVLPYNIAMAYAGLGDADAAFRWLERGYAERASFMGWAKADPGLARLHGDPRWAPLLARMGLTP